MRRVDLPIQQFERHKIGMILWKEFTVRENFKTHCAAIFKPEQRATAKLDARAFEARSGQRTMRTVSCRSGGCSFICKKVRVAANAGMFSSENSNVR